MSEELLPCWDCHQLPEADRFGRECKTRNCQNAFVLYSEMRWNARARPIHELRQRVAELERDGSDMSHIAARFKAEADTLRQRVADLTEQMDEATEELRSLRGCIVACHYAENDYWVRDRLKIEVERINAAQPQKDKEGK